MSKLGDTKSRIMELLGQKSKTLTDISNRLGLSPSTISQHLQELMVHGSIRLVDGRPRKWKYYELSSPYRSENSNNQSEQQDHRN